MGQNQPKVEGKDKMTEATGSPHNPNNLKDRASAKFGSEHEVNPAYGQGGAKGSKGNPGRPT